MGGIDYLTGPELASSLFYLLPISMVAWFAGGWAGILMAIVSTLAGFVADMMNGLSYSHPAIPYWNTAVRLAFFLIVANVLSALQASRQRQEELAQFIVHDLRSPLANVMTGLQTWQEVAGETMNAAEASLVESCLVSSNRMLTLVNSLLDLGQLESGKMPLQRSEVSVKDLVESSLDQVAMWAKRNQITLQPQLDAGVQTVYTDPSVTTRVLVNLLGNAIKFSKPESAIRIRVAPLSATMVAFSVTDQGYGIPTEWTDKVFDKFVQVEARKAGRSVGSGLGLAFCRLAVEAQGGRIWLESAVDKGTTVTFTLPKDAY